MPGTRRSTRSSRRADVSSKDADMPDQEEAAATAPEETDGADESALTDVELDADALAVDSFFEDIPDASVFLLPSAERASKCRSALKAVYAAAARGLEEQSVNDSNVTQQNVATAPLPELHVDGFDPEQVWHQVDLQTEALLKRSRKLIQRIPDDVELLDEDMAAAVDEFIGDGPASDDDGEDVGDDADGMADSEEDGEGSDEDDLPEPSDGARKRKRVQDIDYDELLAHGGRGNAFDDFDGMDEDDLQDDELDEDEEDEGGDMDEDDEDGEEDPEATAEKALVEDDFFHLDDMERFVQQAEAAEARGDRGGLATFREDRDALGEDDEDDDEDTERMFEDMYGEGGDEDEEDMQGLENDEDGDEELDEDEAELERALGGQGAGGGRLKAASEIRYEDFFGTRKPYERNKKPQTPSKRSRVGAAGGDAEAGDDGLEANGRRLARTAGARAGGADMDVDDDDPTLSTHEKRTRRIQAQIAELEREAMNEKEWQLKGEASARTRPVNSALEVDLDFELTLRPPPQPTAEMAQDIEEMIKGRIRDLRFDNVVRVLVSEPESQKVSLELDDSKSKAGLADLYEKDYLAAASGTVEDRHAKIRAEAKSIFTALCAKLDALSHLSFTPKPVLTDMDIKVDAPAIVMEEAAPVTMSTANMRAPEEIHAAKQTKAMKDEAELTQAERQQRRAKKKRIAKRKEGERELKAGIASHAKGIKSAREEAQAAKEAKAAAKGRKPERYKGASSGAVFKKLAEEQAAGGAAAVRRDAAAKKAAEASVLKSSHLKM